MKDAINRATMTLGETKKRMLPYIFLACPGGAAYWSRGSSESRGLGITQRCSFTLRSTQTAERDGVLWIHLPTSVKMGDWFDLRSFL
jgi:hypothetical protein